MFELLAYFVVGCLAGAVAGGWRPFLVVLLDGTGKGRIISALMTGGALAVGALAHGRPTLALVAVTATTVGTWIGEIIFHERPVAWQRIGAPVSYGGAREPVLYLAAAVAGVLQLLLITAPLLLVSHRFLEMGPLALLGVWLVPAYMLGNILPFPLLLVGKNGLVDAPTRWGEMFSRGGFLVVAGAIVHSIT